PPPTAGGHGVGALGIPVAVIAVLWLQRWSPAPLARWEEAAAGMALLPALAGAFVANLPHRPVGRALSGREWLRVLAAVGWALLFLGLYRHVSSSPPSKANYAYYYEVCALSYIAGHLGCGYLVGRFVLLWAVSVAAALSRHASRASAG